MILNTHLRTERTALENLEALKKGDDVVELVVAQPYKGDGVQKEGGVLFYINRHFEYHEFKFLTFISKCFRPGLHIIDKINADFM